MTLTKALVRQPAALLRGKSRLVVVVLISLLILGWLLVLALAVTAVADLIGLGPGALPPYTQEFLPWYGMRCRILPLVGVKCGGCDGAE